jgi:lysophospholipase L1-like esterase
MHSSNHNQKPFLIVYSTLAVIIMIGLLVPKNIWSSYKLSPVNLLADIEQQKIIRKKPAYQAPKTNKKQKEIVRDTVVANVAVAKLIRNDVAIESNDSLVQNVGLSNFLAALHELSGKKNRKVRIGYFGDSMIEGDLITQTIRSILQNRFGGNGVGFIPITSIVSHFRQTVKTQSNENWDDVNYTNNKSKKIIGISGHTFFAKQDATLNVKPGGGKHLSSLYQLSLLCGSSENGLNLTFNKQNLHVATEGYFNVVNLGGDSDLVSEAMISMDESTVPLYGLAAESSNGIILDNLSFRGTSGTELLRLNSKMLRQIDSLRGYDLVVLQYGPNLLYADSIRDFGWYRQQIEKSIRHLKLAFPNTSFLIISTADKSFKIDGEYRTGDGVEALLAAQQEAARRQKCAFYNLYEAMGGYNSMKTWAEKKPILAGNDYTHFNQSGSAKIGRLIANAILNEYEQSYPAK